MENPHFRSSLFTLGVLCLLTVLVLTFDLVPCAAGSDIDIADLKLRAEQGDADAQDQLGRAYRWGLRVPQDTAEAVKWYRKAADQGYAAAQYNLGNICELSICTPEDEAEAVKWYRKAAEQGYTAAQYSLGLKYRKGQVVQKDDKEAVKWFRKAAEQGNVDAQITLGFMYYFGDGVATDYKQAVLWYRKAAEQGEVEAQFHLGFMYRAALGVPKNSLEGANWYRRAAEQGYAAAQLCLGVLYHEGEGVPKNNVEAYKWYNLAAAGGYEQAIEGRRRIEREMTLAQIAEAQRLSAQFVPRKASARTPPEISPSPSRISASATAFFVTEDGYALTSYHVVKDAARVQLWTGSSKFPARLVKSDPANDLALLKVSGKFPALPLQSSRGVELGETVFTVGFPNVPLQGMEPKLTEGKISSLSGVQDDPRYFQISVAVQPGNSGGALVNSKGNVVGVVAAKLSERAALATSGRLPENVNYAVKSSYALSLLESVPEASARLKEPNTTERKFEDVVKEVQSASALVIVGE